MNTQEPFVITISRELGSGGRTLGKKLAAQLGVRFSDKDLIESLREKYGLSTYEIEKVKGKKRNWLSDMLDIVAPLPNNGALIKFPAAYRHPHFTAQVRRNLQGGIRNPPRHRR